MPAVFTNEAVAFVPPRRRLSGQHAGLDLSEGLKDALDVVIGEVGVNRCHVDPVKGSRFLRQLVDDWLSLANVTGPPNLQDKQEGKTQKPKDRWKPEEVSTGERWFKLDSP